MIIKVSTPGKIARTAALAAEIWTDHYTPLIGAEQVAYMLERFQSAEAIEEAIQPGGFRYYLLTEHEADVAYCAVKRERENLFLSKLYVRKVNRGSGFAKRLLRYAIEDHPGISRVWLTVNKGNTGSIAAYQRMGFTIEEAVCNDIGNGFVMDDFVMGASVDQFA